MLVELSIGDAYGAGFEYADPEFTARENDLAAYRPHPFHAIAPGAYTDDTQMSLALAEAVDEDGPWTREGLAGRFLDVFRRDPRLGYAKRFHAFLSATPDAQTFLATMNAASDRSGAAMRATPLGWYPDLAEVLDKAAMQAAITHDTPDGIHAAQASAAAAHYALHDLGSLSDLGAFLAETVPGAWDAPWDEPVGEKGWMSVRAAVTALGAHRDIGAILRASIAFTGDVDTVATIAMAVASAHRDVTGSLPAALIEGLENGPYGRDHLRALDERIAARFPGRRARGLS